MDFCIFFDFFLLGVRRFFCVFLCFCYVRGVRIHVRVWACTSFRCSRASRGGASLTPPQGGLRAPGAGLPATPPSASRGAPSSASLPCLSGPGSRLPEPREPEGSKGGFRGRGFPGGPPQGLRTPVLARFRRPWGALWKTPSPKNPLEPSGSGSAAFLPGPSAPSVLLAPAPSAARLGTRAAYL